FGVERPLQPGGFRHGRGGGSCVGSPAAARSALTRAQALSKSLARRTGRLARQMSISAGSRSMPGMPGRTRNTVERATTPREAVYAHAQLSQRVGVHLQAAADFKQVAEAAVGRQALAGQHDGALDGR